MARRKRREKISGLDLRILERHIGVLRIAMTDAQTGLTPFRAHYDALSQLHDDLETALNLLHDRPADYRRPHMPPMSNYVPPEK